MQLDRKMIAIAFASASLLVGCSKQGPGNQASGEKSVAEVDAEIRAIRAAGNRNLNAQLTESIEARHARLFGQGTQAATPPPVAASVSIPDPDRNTPTSAYQLIDDNLRLMMLYQAFSGLPVDYVALAQAMSSEYRSTTDEFKKQDLMGALKPKIDAKLAEAKANRYYMMTTQLSLGHYNFGTKSFPVPDLSEGTEFSFNYAQPSATVTNGGQFSQYKVEDVTLAKEMEGRVATGKAGGRGTLYLYLRDTDSSRGQRIRFQIVKVEIQDRSGKMFAAF